MRTRFDYILGPVVMSGCMLKRSAEGRAIAILPRCRSNGSSVRMLRDRDHAQICQFAGAAYGAIEASAVADDA